MTLAALCEFVDEAEAMVAHAGREGIFGDALCLVGLTPAVRAELRRRHIPCRSTLDFFDTASHRKIVLELEEMCRFVQDHLHVPDGFLVRQTYRDSVVFHVRMFLAHLMVHVEILHRIQEQVPVGKWAAARRRSVPHGFVTPNPLIRDDERYVGELTKAFTDQRGIPCVEVDAGKDGGGPPEAAPGGRSVLLDGCIRTVCRFLLRSISSRPTALISNPGYGMDDLVRRIGARYPRIVWLWPDTETKVSSWIELKKCLKRSARILLRGEKGPFLVPLHFLSRHSARSMDEARRLCAAFEKQFLDWIRENPDLFSYRGVRLGPWLMNKIQTDIAPAQAGIFRSAAALEELVSVLNPKFVLSHTSSDALCALGELCAHRQVPAVLISHGSSVPAREREAQIEHDHVARRLIHSTYPAVALQSPWAARFAEDARVPARRLRTGPLIWSRLPDGKPLEDLRDRIKRRVSPDLNGRTRIVLHASTPRTRAAHHFFICEYPDEYLRSVQDLLEAVSEIEDCVLVVRFRPSGQFSKRDLLDLLPKSDRLLVSADGRFSEVLSIADLLVSFYSATVEEAVHNGIPALIYGGGGRYVQLPARMIDSAAAPAPSAVYAVREKKYLSSALRNLLAAHAGRRLPPELAREHCFQPDQIESFTDLVGSWL